MRELIWGKTLRSRLIRYNFFIIWVIAIFVSVCTYITASRKTLEVAKNSLQHHVESISYRYQLAYEEMINIVLNCTERKTFNLGEIGRGLTPGARKKGLDYAELIKDYCAISEYGDYIVKLSVFDDRGWCRPVLPLEARMMQRGFWMGDGWTGSWIRPWTAMSWIWWTLPFSSMKDRSCPLPGH